MKFPWALFFAINCMAFCPISAYSQSVARHTFSAFGASKSFDGLCFQHTAGQSSHTSNRQGFIQPPGNFHKTQLSLVLFPNPASHTIEVAPIYHSYNFSIQTLTGSIVLTGTVSINQSTIDISTLPAGIYLLASENFEFKTLKFNKIN